MSKIEAPDSLHELPQMILKNIVALATGGFGVVVALAWTEVIKTVVAEYVDPFLGKNGSLVSLVLYASIMTVLAVVVTMQLAQMQKKVDSFGQFITKTRSKAKSARKK